MGTCEYYGGGGGGGVVDFIFMNSAMLISVTTDGAPE